MPNENDLHVRDALRDLHTTLSILVRAVENLRSPSFSEVVTSKELLSLAKVSIDKISVNA
jgi:hypothetical protein